MLYVGSYRAGGSDKLTAVGGNTGNIFYDFWVGRRKRGETAAEFTRHFKQRYAKVTARGPECKISERMLSLVLLFQLVLLFHSY